MAQIPNSRPQADREQIDNILKVKGVNRKEYPVCIVAVRGYYLDSMGEKGKNDRGVFDDAACVISPSAFTTVNFNTDPSGFRKGVGTGSSKGMASLNTGIWFYKVGSHKGKSPAMNQAQEVVVTRDGNPPYADKGYFGINHHWGSASGGTSSLGCQTVPPVQWPSYINTIVAEGKRYGQKVFPYVLITEEERRQIYTDSARTVSAPTPIVVGAHDELDLAPAEAIIKEFEGLFLKPYEDPVGIPTIGWGTIQYPNGKKVTLHDDSISQAQAQEYLMFEINQKVTAMEKLIKVDVTNNQFCALTSFTYNLGIGALADSSLLRMLNAGAPRVEVADQFLRWVNAGGHPMAGLIRRRRMERELYLTPGALIHV